MVEKVAVQISIQIKIKKSRLRGQSLKVQAIVLGMIRKREVAIVDKKLVAGIELLITPYPTHINIQEPIAVDIGHCHARFPIPGPPCSRILRNILELPIAPVEVQL